MVKRWRAYLSGRRTKMARLKAHPPVTPILDARLYLPLYSVLHTNMSAVVTGGLTNGAPARTITIIGQG